jgi:hypothetical protein
MGRIICELLESRTLLSKIALFYNGAYVDTNVAGDGIAAEANNVRLELLAQGNSVTTFSNISPSGITSALAGADLLVMPMLKIGDLKSALSIGAKTAIQSFVQNGGGYVNLGDWGGRNTGLLQSLFSLTVGYPEGSPGGSTLSTSAAKGTLYAGGNSTVSSNVNTQGLPSVPAGTLSIYNGANGTTKLTTLGLFTYGGRRDVSYLAWDWHNGGPTGSQDGGWNDVLMRTTEQVGRTAAPSGLTAMAKSPSEIDLTWKNNALNQTGFEIDRAISISGQFTKIATVGSAITHYNNINLSRSSTYYYRVRTINGTYVTAQTSTASAKTFSGPFAHLSGKTLIITGTLGSDVITLVSSGGNYVTNLNGVSLTFSKTAITAISFIASPGNDDVYIGAGVIGVNAQLGDGTDMISAANGHDTLLAGNGTDLLIGLGGSNLLEGGTGNDTFIADDGKIDTIIGGSGDDIAQITLGVVTSKVTRVIV